MFHVNSVDQYNRRCERQDNTGYHLQANFDDDGNAQITWGNSPTPLNREQLVAVLMAIPVNETIEITTGSF